LGSGIGESELLVVVRILADVEGEAVNADRLGGPDVLLPVALLVGSYNTNLFPPSASLKESLRKVDTHDEMGKDLFCIVPFDDFILVVVKGRAEDGRCEYREVNEYGGKGETHCEGVPVGRT
jgi:hypothetical protein